MEMLSVAAIVTDEGAVLVDRHGRTLSSTRVNLDRIGPVESKTVLIDRLWRATIQRLINRLWQRAKSRCADPWSKRADGLVKSFRLRLYNERPIGPRVRLENFPTTTWWAAAKRMVWQGHNRARRHDMTGWIHWAHTASNNTNRRQREKHGSDTHHLSESGDGEGQRAGIPLCHQW